MPIEVQPETPLKSPIQPKVPTCNATHPMLFSQISYVTIRRGSKPSLSKLSDGRKSKENCLLRGTPQRSGAFSWSRFKGCGRWPGSSLTEKHLNKWRESHWRYLFDRANEDSASI